MTAIISAQLTNVALCWDRYEKENTHKDISFQHYCYFQADRLQAVESHAGHGEEGGVHSCAFFANDPFVDDCKLCT